MAAGTGRNLSADDILGVGVRPVFSLMRLGWKSLGRSLQEEGAPVVPGKFIATEVNVHSWCLRWRRGIGCF